MSCPPPPPPIAQRLEFHQAMEQDYRHVDVERTEADGLFELVGEASLEGYTVPPTWDEMAKLVAVLERARELIREYDMPFVPDETGSLDWCHRARIEARESLAEVVEAAAGCLGADARA